MKTKLRSKSKAILRNVGLTAFALFSTLSFAFAQFNGGTGTISDPYQIADVTQLQAMNTALDKHFILTQNIDASITSTWNSGAGFEPIGPTAVAPFTGSLDGKGFKITKLFIARQAVQGVGLFGNLFSSNFKIQNIGLDSAYIIGGNRTGALVGNKEGKVINCYSTGTVIGNSTVGGLIGRNGNSELSNSYSSCSVLGSSSVGGLAGSGSFIIKCYASGNVSSSGTVGGLVGEISSAGGIVRESFSTGDVTCSGTSAACGGLIGRVQAGTIELCYSISKVTGNRVGGLIGMSNGGTVKRCYSTARIFSNGGFGSIVAGLIAENEFKVYDCYSNVKITYTGTENSVTLAGLIGRNQDHSDVMNSYAVVKFNSTVGQRSGLAGTNEQSSQDTATMKNCYWNIDSSGVVPGIANDQTNAQVVTSLLDAQMRQRNSFPLWNFDTVWTITENVTFPFHKTTVACQNTYLTDSISACKSYTWINGITYTSSNNVDSFVVSNTSGCDTIIYLHLNITTIDTSVKVSANVLTANPNNPGSTYQWYDCTANTIISNATNQVFTATSTGSYAVIISTATCVDTSSCFSIVVSGVSSEQLKAIQVYPNPTSNKIYFELKNNAEVILMDLTGRIVYQSKIDKGNQSIDLTEFENGMYVLNVVSDEGIYASKILKQ